VAEEEVALVEQVVARAERAVVPAVQAAQARVVRAEPVRVVQAPAEPALVRVVQVRRAVQARLALEQVWAPALELERRVPVAQPRAELVPARVRPVLVQREPAAVPAPRERVPAQGPAVVAVPLAEAGERAALMSSMRSCAARRRCMSPSRRMCLSRCGLSAASATALANRAASSSKPW
jgi:hypothetical protein